MTNHRLQHCAAHSEIHDETANQQGLSKEDLQQHIRYARTIKPQFTEAAKQKLVEHYRELREGDCQGAQRATYHIIVRQLELMIRLSEALARLHCEKEIQVKYVDEAKRLLKMSIINVKSSDVSLDDFDTPDADEDEDAPPVGSPGGGNGGEGGDGGDGGDRGGRGADTDKQNEEDTTLSQRGKRARDDDKASPAKGAESPAKSAKSPAKFPAKSGAAAGEPAEKHKL